MLKHKKHHQFETDELEWICHGSTSAGFVSNAQRCSVEVLIDPNANEACVALEAQPEGVWLWHAVSYNNETRIWITECPDPWLALSSMPT